MNLAVSVRELFPAAAVPPSRPGSASVVSTSSMEESVQVGVDLLRPLLSAMLLVCAARQDAQSKRGFPKNVYAVGSG